MDIVTDKPGERRSRRKADLKKNKYQARGEDARIARYSHEGEGVSVFSRRYGPARSPTATARVVIVVPVSIHNGEAQGHENGLCSF